MKEKFDVIVVVPIGPNANFDFLKDTINSYKYYSSVSYKIILSDDSNKNIGAKIANFFGNIDVVCSDKNYGLQGGLYITLSKVYLYALDNYHFNAILKLDDDALIINPAPEKEVLSIIDENSKVGMVGRLQSGIHSTDSFGFIYTNHYSRNTLLHGTCTLKFFKRPIINFILRNLLFKAFENGYELGQSIFGGSYFISRNLLIELKNKKLLPEIRLRKSILEEDHLFSLMSVAVGFELHDLSNAGQPFAVAWKQLPASPETLFNAGKKIIHSTRSWDKMNEATIREYFFNKRV